MGSVQLGNKLITEDNQMSASIDINRYGDRYFPFGSWKSGNGKSVDFGQNADEKIEINL